MYKQVKERYSPPPVRCDGVGSTGYIPAEYRNITPTYRVVCNGCGDEFKPVGLTWSIPNHPPQRMKMFFIAKFEDTCSVVRHPIHKGDQVRYFGTKIVCKAHA
jgi:hypothetical protein